MEKLHNQFLCSRMMLPEHVEALSQHNKEKQNEEMIIPSFDEQELENWEHLIKQSLEQGTEITITYISNSAEKSVSGAVIRFDGSTGRIIIGDKNGWVGMELKEIVGIKE